MVALLTVKVRAPRLRYTVRKQLFSLGVISCSGTLAEPLRDELGSDTCRRGSAWGQRWRDMVRRITRTAIFCRIRDSVPEGAHRRARLRPPHKLLVQ